MKFKPVTVTNGDKPNTILKAILECGRNFGLAAFSCLVEVVRQAPDAGEGNRLNGMFLDMLASGFWSNTMQGMRRLAEIGPITGPGAHAPLED